MSLDITDGAIRDALFKLKDAGENVRLAPDGRFFSSFAPLRVRDWLGRCACSYIGTGGVVTQPSASQLRAKSAAQAFVHCVSRPRVRSRGSGMPVTMHCASCCSVVV